WISPAISGSVRSTCGMGGWCIRRPPRSAPRLPTRAPTTGNKYGCGGGRGGRDRAGPRIWIMSTTSIPACHPGIDDALAIAFAAGHPEIELAGITTVAGNVELAKTTANALAVVSFVGAASVPVTAGCAAPLLRPARHAGHVHGESGLGS